MCPFLSWQKNLRELRENFKHKIRSLDVSDEQDKNKENSSNSVDTADSIVECHICGDHIMKEFLERHLKMNHDDGVGIKSAGTYFFFVVHFFFTFKIWNCVKFKIKTARVCTFIWKLTSGYFFILIFTISNDTSESWIETTVMIYGPNFQKKQKHDDGVGIKSAGTYFFFVVHFFFHAAIFFES